MIWGWLTFDEGYQIVLFGVRDERFLLEDIIYELVNVRPKKFQKKNNLGVWVLLLFV